MSNQYEVLGKAPTPEDLKKLSPNEIHLTIKTPRATYCQPKKKVQKPSLNI